jgi:hypothetical protein
MIAAGGSSSAVLIGNFFQKLISIFLAQKGYTGLSDLEIMKQLSTITGAKQMPIKIVCTTFNVGSQTSSLSKENLSSILFDQSSRKSMVVRRASIDLEQKEEPRHDYIQSNADLYVIAYVFTFFFLIFFRFQEIVKLGSREVAKDLADKHRDLSEMKIFCESQLQLVFREKFGKSEEKAFEMIFSRQMVGLLLCVFVRRELLENISDLRWNLIRLGVLNKMVSTFFVKLNF